MAKKRRLLTAAAAVATSAVLMLGGTFAWQSISQTALNEASDVINPGGRLHDDFYIDNNGDYNADIYVENFADDEIFARVRLEEYMEVVINQGVAGAEVVDTIVGSKSLNGATVTDKATDKTSGYEYSYVTHYFDKDNVTDEYWNWTMGDGNSETVYYMPTFNMNKDSLVADRNGMYVDRIGGISNRDVGQYEDYNVWADGDTKPGTEIYDVDTNTVDEVGYAFENLQTYADAGHIATRTETHAAAMVGYTNGLISMSDWLELLNTGEDTDNYWVYDTDGWVYWSSPIEGGKTTGLLLDAIELNQVMDDTWYYAINVIGQFCTAGDVDGFYHDGEAPSSDAEILLEEIGAGTGSAADDFIAQAGTVDSNGGISLSIDSPYINVDGNTITINAGAADADGEQWYTAPTTLTGTNLLWANLSSRIAYKLNEGTGEYEEWGSYVTADNEYGYENSGYSEPFDMCMGEGLDIYLWSEYAEPGTYKIVGSGTDENGEEWSGEVVLTVDYVADEGGDEDEEPEDPYGFSHLLLGFDVNSDLFVSDTFVDYGYAQPGDIIPFSAVAYYNDGTTAAISNENAEWSITAVEGSLTEGTSISDTGLLTIDENQQDLTVINVAVSFTDKFGAAHTKDQSFLVSAEAVTLALTMVDEGPYYAGDWYKFTATATNASGETVPMEWSYDIVPQYEEAMLDATIDAENNTFTASDAGDYYLRAWAEYMTGQYAQVELTVMEEIADTTAPTVESVEGDGLFYTFTITDVSDADFPMTMNVYWALNEESVYAEDNGAVYTVQYTLDDDGNITQTGGGTDAADANVTYENGTVTSYLNTTVEQSGYWGVTVTDAANNVGKLESPIAVDSALGCFVAGTQVQTVNGLVNIEDIQVGDQVYSIDLTTGEKVVSPVIWVQGTRYTEATYTIYAGSEEIVTTYEHPFYVIDKGWVAAEDLSVGDEVKTMDGQLAVTDIVYTELDKPLQVYNFMVDGTHNYLITEAGILVHNISK